MGWQEQVRGAGAPSWRHTRLRSPVPSTAHQLLSRPQLPLSYFPETRRTSEGTDSPGVKKHCDSVIKADQWLRQAHFSRRHASFRDCFMFTIHSWFGLRLGLKPGLPASLACDSTLDKHCTPRQKAVSFREGKSPSLESFWDGTAEPMCMWLFPGLAPKAPLM